MYKKKNGIYYTPSALAEFLAGPLISELNQTVLDPAYGEGSLLLAAEKISKIKNNRGSIQLHGCDIKTVNGLLQHLPEANLLKIDFFDYPTEKKFHTILMNPPYVRHHIQNSRKILKYRATHSNMSILNYASDLWALFLIKALAHLIKDGNVGAILPWAFLQADYSLPIRKLLVDNFGLIEVVALSDKYFEGADERIVVVWLKKFGVTNTSIQIASSTNFQAPINFAQISTREWLADRVINTFGIDSEKILCQYESEYGFRKLSNYADIKIGVVTGAVEHFIITKEQVNEYGISDQRLIPILTNSNEFPKYLIEGKKNLKLLVALEEGDHLKFRKFIRRGIEGKYNLRAHSILRNPWYAVKVGKLPDAFFHYRISKTPFLLPNDFKAQCTNAFHRIYFKNLSQEERKWIYVSMLSLPAQLSVELLSKTYGRGILKIEPKTLKNIIVFKGSNLNINSAYNIVIKLLSEDKKEEAMKYATEFIQKELKISEELIDLSNNLFNSLRELRISNK